MVTNDSFCYSNLDRAMSSLFKRSVLERIPDVYSLAKDEHADLGADGYKIAITALLGITPTDWETDEVFRERRALTLSELYDIVNYKLAFLCVEQYMGDVFRRFDGPSRGYVTVQDVRRVWEELNCELPWSRVRECFLELTRGDVMDYSTFCEVLTGNESPMEIDLRSVYNRLGIRK